MDNLKTNHQLIHSFCLMPGLHFEEQEPDEKVILAVRAHPVSQIPWLINSLIMIFTLVIINFFLPGILKTRYIFFIDFFLFSVILSYFWSNIVSWHFNVGIITNHRIVDIDYSSVLYKEVSTAMLGKIEDVTAKTGGFFASFVDYGTVHIQTAGTEINLDFINIPKPTETAKIINSLVNKK